MEALKETHRGTELIREARYARGTQTDTHTNRQTRRQTQRQTVRQTHKV